MFRRVIEDKVTLAPGRRFRTLDGQRMIFKGISNRPISLTVDLAPNGVRTGIIRRPTAKPFSTNLPMSLRAPHDALYVDLQLTRLQGSRFHATAQVSFTEYRRASVNLTLMDDYGNAILLCPVPISTKDRHRSATISFRHRL